jgi:acyl carrier protein
MAIDIHNRVEQILTTEFDVPSDKITFDAAYDEMGIDSLVVLELAMLLETELCLTITEREISESRSLDGLVRLLKSKYEVNT